MKLLEIGSLTDYKNRTVSSLNCQLIGSIAAETGLQKEEFIMHSSCNVFTATSENLSSSTHHVTLVAGDIVKFHRSPQKHEHFFAKDKFCSLY